MPLTRPPTNRVQTRCHLGRIIPLTMVVVHLQRQLQIRQRVIQPPSLLEEQITTIIRMPLRPASQTKSSQISLSSKVDVRLQQARARQRQRQLQVLVVDHMPYRKAAHTLPPMSALKLLLQVTATTMGSNRSPS